jgi:hypothetical protein
MNSTVLVLVLGFVAVVGVLVEITKHLDAGLRKIHQQLVDCNESLKRVPIDLDVINMNLSSLIEATHPGWHDKQREQDAKFWAELEEKAKRREQRPQEGGPSAG